MKKICSIAILFAIFVNLIVPMANAINEVDEEEITHDTNTIEEQESDVQKIPEEQPSVEPTDNLNEVTDEELEEPKENKDSNQFEEDRKEQKEQEQIQTIAKPMDINLPSNVQGLDGRTFIIESAMDSSKCLDIFGAYTNSGANLQIFNKNGNNNQKFKFHSVDGGKYYTIEAVHSGQVLDVYGAYKNNGTNVTQFINNKQDNQKWVLRDLGGGIYNIVSSNGLYLDVYGAYTESGTNVQIFKNNGGTNQKFRLKEVGLKAESTLGNGGIYEIKANIGTNMFLDIYGADNTSGQRLQIYQRNGNRNQKFRITKNESDNYYTITALHSGQVLDVYGAYKTNGTKITQYTKKTSGNKDNQQWIIKKDRDGKNYNIISKCNELFMDIHGANGNKGTSVEVFQETGGANQKFELIKIDENYINNPPVALGKYKIALEGNESKVLQVEGASAKDGTKLQLANNANVKEQIFSLKYNEDGTYIIEPTFSERTIEIKDNKISNGVAVQEYRNVGGDNQRWKFNSKGSNTFYIESAENPNFGMKVGNNNYIEISKSKQKFKLIPFGNTASNEALLFDGTYKVISKLADNMALDVIDGSKETKKGLQLWNNLHVLNQKMIFKHIGNNIYTIKIAHTGMALEISTDGSNSIRQNTVRDDADEQQWKLEDAGNGYYYIRSKKYNNLYLNVNSNTNGTRVTVSTKTGKDNQKWKIQEMYFGVDLSEHDNVTNYSELKKSGQIEFMITRVGWFSGSKNQFVTDKEFEENYQNAKKQGIKLGAYLYSYAQSDSDARREATALVNKLKAEGKTSDKFDLPIFLDIEDSKFQGGLSVQQRTNICLIYGQILKNAGYKVGIYTYKNWALSAIDMNQIPSDYALWIAAWGVNNGSVPKEVNKYYGDHDIWQYTSNGDVVGIPGRVDLNVTYKKLW